MPVRVYGDYNEILLDEIVWINSTTTFVLSASTQPTEVSLLYDGYILVDLVSYDIDSLDTQNIQVVGTPSLAEFWGPIPIKIVVSIAVTGVVWVLAFYVLRKRSLRGAV